MFHHLLLILKLFTAHMVSENLNSTLLSFVNFAAITYLKIKKQEFSARVKSPMMQNICATLYSMAATT